MQELQKLSKNLKKISFTPNVIPAIRGIFTTAHVFVKEKLKLKEIYSDFYKNKPFIRVIDGIPNLSAVRGSNFCDIGFEIKKDSNRIVVMSAIDNLVKGASGWGYEFKVWIERNYWIVDSCSRTLNLHRLTYENMKITIEIIRSCFTQYQVKYSDHALYEMKYEEKGVIKTKELYEAVMNGEIIEEYPDDKPFPSVLINGKTKMDRNIHVVCAYSEETPDLLRWESDYKTRRKTK